MLLLLFQQDQGVYSRVCVYIHVHAHTLTAAGMGYRSAQDYSSRAAVNTEQIQYMSHLAHSSEGAVAGLMLSFLL